MSAGAAPPDDGHRHAAAVAALGVSPAVLRRLLAGMSAAEAWRRLRDGRHPEDPQGRHRRRAAAYPPEVVAAACAAAGATVLRRGDTAYPAFLDDDEAPEVLFATGDWADTADRPRVAVVGTRAPTRAGVRTAADLGHDLAGAGVVVVSGLARGIDAAAHRAALSADPGAPVLGVLGAAPDAALPPADDELRRAVAGHGALLSEVPPGVPGSRWMFAVRNRVMAAAAHAVVVVESHTSGGSLHTVRAARRRRRPVAVVPGSVHSPASAGTNRLLVTGEAVAVRGADDVLALLRRAHPDPSPAGPGQGWLPLAAGGTTGGRRPARRGRPTPPAAPTPRAGAVLAALDHQPATVDAVAARCGLALGEAALALEELAAAGSAHHEHGWWSRSRGAPTT